jgi:hypothetical protein
MVLVPEETHIPNTIIKLLPIILVPSLAINCLPNK